MPVTPDTFKDMAKLAEYYDADERFWTRPCRKFRFKRQNHLPMGALHLMRRRDIIEEHEGWQAAGTTTWTFSKHGESVCKRLEHSCLMDMNEEQRTLIEGSLDAILDVPVGEDFVLSDDDVNRGARAWLHKRNFITMVEEHDVESCWRATRLTERIQSECRAE